MAEFSQFVAVFDDEFHLPDGEDFSREFNFDLANLDVSRTVVVMIRISGEKLFPTVNPEIRIEINGSVEVELLLDSPTLREPRSWHEVVRGGVFQESSNVLRVIGRAGSAIRVASIVVLYHAIQ